jgi:hypothetical protein
VNELARSSSPHLLPVAPRVAIATRVAMMADLPFLDALQKQHSKALGFFPRAQMEGYVQNGWVLVAEPSTEYSVPSTEAKPLGYVISRDRYLKRDELGVVYQLCVVPGHQRGLIGASLIRAVFERSAYGCKLYCCWCAQDLAANHFWESLGFVPIAFRAGSTGKRRVHIFWQRRINVDDVSTAYWYPFQTNAGAIREDRLVFPIPPGTHWTEVQAIALPPQTDMPALDAPRRKAARKAQTERPKPPVGMEMRRLRFAPPSTPPDTAKKPTPQRVNKPTGPERSRRKIDPVLAAKARELRDRCLERLNGSPDALPAPAARYEVSRAVASSSSIPLIATQATIPPRHALGTAA